MTGFLIFIVYFGFILGNIEGFKKIKFIVIECLVVIVDRKKYI